jgi:predicted metal-dependent hydrolase
MNTNETMMVVNELPVKVVRKKIKNLHLAVYPPDGRVRVAVPEVIDDEAVRLAVISKLSWIKRKIKFFEDQPRQSVRELVTGESHYYLGRRYLLDIAYTEKYPFVEMKNKKTLVLNIKKNSRLEQRKKLLVDWYRQEMKYILPSIIKKWELKSKLKVSAYGIKRMKTRWGSCNPTHKRIWLNLELIKKPIHCLEYVVVHEIVHFLERTHNDQFVFHMDRIMPQWRTIRDELNRSSLPHENWGAQ